MLFQREDGRVAASPEKEERTTSFCGRERAKCAMCVEAERMSFSNPTSVEHWTEGVVARL